MTNDNQKTEQIEPQVLEVMQKEHLDWLESFGAMFWISGVPIVLALNYELIQMFNGMAMQALLGESDS